MSNETTKKPDRGFSTKAIHTHLRTPPVPSESIATPLFQTASFAFESTEAIGDAIDGIGDSFVYSRSSNPTVDVFERSLAELESTEAAAGFASGMAAIHAAILSTCSAGEHILAPRNLYGGAYNLMRNVLPRLGIETTFVDAQNPDGWRAAARPNTRVVYLETISNPSLNVPDLPAFSQLAKELNVRMLVDSTFATPYLCRPAEHGADLVIHSASKYLGGHGDLIAGAVVGHGGPIAQVRRIATQVGGIMAPFVAWLILRGMKTLPIRMERHVANAQCVAEFLDGHERIVRVYHPGLATHPSQAVAARMLPLGYGGMVAFELDGDQKAGRRMLDRLQIFKRAGSLGDVHSLALHPASASHRHMSPEDRQHAGICDGFFRLSIGLEDVDDLLADLEQALNGD